MFILRAVNYVCLRAILNIFIDHTCLRNVIVVIPVYERMICAVVQHNDPPQSPRVEVYVSAYLTSFRSLLLLLHFRWRC